MSKRTAVILAAAVGLSVGLACGFFLGVLSTEAGRDFFEDIATSEMPADVERPKKIARKGFRLEYPGNWSIDDKDKDYDPDHQFTLESPGDSFSMVMIFDGVLDSSDLLDGQEEHFASIISSPKRSNFTKWGGYTGAGLQLKGRILGINAGGVRIFAYPGTASTFMVVEFYFDEDLKHTQPGFDLIRSSFKLVESGGGTPTPAAK